MIVGKPRLESGALSAAVSTPEREIEIRHAAPGPLSETTDAFLPATLLPAMRLGLDLVFEAPLSPRLLGAVPHLQDIFHSWSRRFRTIRVEADPRSPSAADGDRNVGCFFTCGVDSFFSALTRLGEVDELVFALGFAKRIAGTEQERELVDHVRAAARELGKPLVELETNIRFVWDDVVGWEFFHGGALASIGLALAPRFGRIYIPPSHQSQHDGWVPWGSHPEVDPFWSTEDVAFSYADPSSSRFERVAMLAEHDVALRHLQVCWERRNEEYNCCRCEKCLRAMVTLHILGKLDRSPAFPLPLEAQAVAALRVYPRHTRQMNEDNLRALEASGRDDELQRAIRTAISPPLALRIGRYIRRKRRGLPVA
jgi:hypothetical protein